MTFYTDTMRFVWKGDYRMMEAASYEDALRWIVSMLPSTGYRISDRTGKAGE